MIPKCNLAFAVATLSGSASAWLSGLDPNNLPYKADPGSYGYNQCGTKASPDSKCQNIHLRSAEDFCLFGPHDLSGVSETEREAVSYCTQDGHGSRLIPPGTFESVHFVHTPHYVQITGRGNFTKMNVLAGDDGGELDAAGYDARGNPIGGAVLGQNNQFEHWTEFLLPDEFCIRACFKGPDDWRYCNHIYDIMACRWNVPGDYTPGFSECEGEDVPHPMGEYLQPDGKIKIWKQGDKPIPPPGAPGKLKSCRQVSPPGSLYNAPNVTSPALNATMPAQNSTMPAQNTTMPAQDGSTLGSNSSTGGVSLAGQNPTDSSNYPSGGSGDSYPGGSGDSYPGGSGMPNQNTTLPSQNTTLPDQTGKSLGSNSGKGDVSLGDQPPSDSADYPSGGSGDSSPADSSAPYPSSSDDQVTDHTAMPDFNLGTISKILQSGANPADQSGSSVREITYPGMDATISTTLETSTSTSTEDVPMSSGSGSGTGSSPSEEPKNVTQAESEPTSDESDQEDDDDTCLP